MKRLIVLMHYFVIQTPDVSSGKCFQYWFRKYCYFTKGLLYVWFLCIGSGRNKNAISNKFLLSQKMSINGYHVPFIVIHAFFCTKTFFANTECFLHLFSIGFLLPFSTLVSNKNIRKTFSYFISVLLSCSKQFQKVKTFRDDGFFNK